MNERVQFCTCTYMHVRAAAEVLGAHVHIRHHVQVDTLPRVARPARQPARPRTF